MLLAVVRQAPPLLLHLGRPNNEQNAVEWLLSARLLLPLLLLQLLLSNVLVLSPPIPLLLPLACPNSCTAPVSAVIPINRAPPTPKSDRVSQMVV